MAGKRFRAVYRVMLYDAHGRFVGGTRLGVEPPVEVNLRAYVDSWKSLNPWARVAKFDAFKEGWKDVTHDKRA